jgi:hypothetical protein
MQGPELNNPGLSEIEEPDYYWEDEKLVFTAAYLKKRGFCCRSGCRHCPYGFKQDQSINPIQDSMAHPESLPASK